jgi:hypothetical protein
MTGSLTTIWCCISLLLPVTFYYLVLGASNTSCPTAFYYNPTTNKCECDELLVRDQYIQCNQLENRAYVSNGVCLMTGVTNDSYNAGKCRLTMDNWRNTTNRLWSELPTDPGKLNATMCGPYNREGLLCGKCIDGYGPPAYSLDLKCVNCSRFSTGFSIFLYLLIDIVPTTLFFVCSVIFRVNVTSGPLLGYFLFCQFYLLLGFYGSERSLYFASVYASNTLKILYHVSRTLSEMWTLLFFMSLIPPFCISERLSTVHIQLLALLPAIYVFILVFTICILMELYARNCRIILFLWRPFGFIFKNTQFSVGNAIIHTFSTFIFLSSTTLILNASSLTSHSRIVFVSSTDKVARPEETVLYFDPTIIYGSHEHIVYQFIALVPCVFLVLIPAVLLCVYPTRIYRRLSQLISTRKQLAITAFAEALHNCFKDGLNGTRDYRALAGLIILVLPVCSSVKYITWKAFNAAGYSRHCITGYLSFALSLVVAYVRPCKSNLANLSLSYHAFMIGVLSFESSRWIDLTVGTEGLELTLVVIPLLSHILVISWAVYTSVKYIRSHYVSCFSFCPCNNFCSGCVRAVNRFVRGGYQRLPDAAPLMGI